jgi:hypothetical protein
MTTTTQNITISWADGWEEGKRGERERWEGHLLA